MLEPFPRCHHCPVVLEYVLQFTDDSENEAVEKCLWCKGDYAKLSANILPVDWFLEFDGRSVNDAFLYLVGILQSLVERFVPVRKQTHVPIYMRSPPSWLAREKALRWREYTEVKRKYGRHHDLASVALDAFNQVNYKYRYFVRSNQCLYESSIVGKLMSAPKLFHSYIRRKKGCPSIGPLKTEYGRVVSDACDMSELHTF